MKQKLWIAILTIAMTLCMAFGLAACGLLGEHDAGDTGNNSQTEQPGDKDKIPDEDDENSDDNVSEPDEELVPSEGLEFMLNEDGESYAVIGIGTCKDTDIVIPSKHNGLPVTAIRGTAFMGCESLESIVIPDGVTEIASWTFITCSSLKNVVIPDSVTAILEAAFAGCTSLESIVIPDSVIGIGRKAFYRCSSLKNVVIGNGVSVIASAAFAECISLESVEIPDSVTTILEVAFAGCTSLESITVSAGNPVYYSDGNCLIETESKTLIFGCNNSVIPADGSVTSLGDYAFSYCTSLESIVIPDSVIGIGREAFSHCSSLKNVVIGNGVSVIASAAFAECISLESIVIPDSVTSIGDYAFSYCTSLESIVIPDGVTEIRDGAFALCKNLTSVYYKGTAADWNEISIGSDNTYLTNATRYYYSETKPTEEMWATGDNYWHYTADMVPTVWVREE